MEDITAMDVEEEKPKAHTATVFVKFTELEFPSTLIRYGAYECYENWKVPECFFFLSQSQSLHWSFSTGDHSAVHYPLHYLRIQEILNGAQERKKNLF